MTKRQALVIGINEYPFEGYLPTAAQDAEKIAQLLEEYGSFEVHRLPIYDEREVSQDLFVTLPELKTAITRLFQPESVIIPETALLFFAGHGSRRQKNGQTEGFLVTSCHDDNCRESGLFSLKDLHQILKNSPVQQQIVWLDCCHSGELFNFTETNLGKETRGRDRCLIVASREFETAIGGVLTPALLAGLNPENNSDGWVTNYTLTDFIDKKLNAEKPQQHHRCSNPTGIIHLTGKNGVLANIRPYRGLKYFDFNPEQLKACDDHKYFYGRTNLTKQLLQKLRDRNFIAVLGVSGSGKSSLVRAGLLYQLYLGKEIVGSHSWKLYPSFRPGKHPLESLKNVIGVEADQLEALVNQMASADRRVVLVIDQFEEIFTECKDDAERQKFFNCLLKAVEGLGHKLCLVLVMRSDFEGRFHQPEYEKIGRKISQKQNLFRVEQMTDVELREAIIEPAKKVEIEVETELVTSLIKQVENSPGYLPLLQFTLDKLWQQSQKKRLINSDLTKLGGVAGALEQHADEIYDSLLQDEDKNRLPNQQGLATQQVAKWIFVALTRLNVEGDDTRRQVRKEDLLTDKSPEAKELLEQVIKRLADAKLIVTSHLETENKKIPVVDIAHEALIRYWPRLYSWLHENREALLIRQNIEDAAQTWREQDKNNPHQLSHSKPHKFIDPFIHYFSLLVGKNRSYLLSGKKLKEAADFIKKEDIQLSKVAEDFLNLSLQCEKYSRSMRILLFSIFGLLGTTLYFKSRVSLSQNLVKQAEDLRKQPAEFQTSMLLAMEAVRIHESLETTQNLWHGLTLLPQNIQNITNTSPKNDDIGFSKTKKYQVTTLENYHFMLKAWNNSQKKYEEIYPSQPFGYVNHVSYEFSHNDHYLATRYGKYGGHSEVLSDMTNHTKAETENVKLGGEYIFKKIAFSYNSKYIATVNHDNKIELWDANSRKKIWEIKSTTQLNEIAFSPGDKYLAVTDSSEIRLLEPRTKKIKTINWQNSNGGKIVFSPEGKYLFGTSQLDKSAYSESSVFVSQVWDIETESEVARFTDKDEIQKVTYSSDEKFLNIEYRNGTVKQWEPANRWILSLRTQDDILSLNFSDDGKYLVAIGETNGGVSADIWDVNSHKKIKTFGLASNSSPATTVVYAVLFSNDFKYLFISLNVGGISGYRTQLHETQSGNEISSFWDDYLSFEESCKSRSIWKAEKYSARCIDNRKIILKENSNNREIILSKPATFSRQDFMKQIKQHDRKAMFIIDYILSEERFKEIVSEKKDDNINSMTFSKDRKLLAVADATGTENNIIKLVSLPQNKLTDEVCQRLTRNFTKEEWKQYLPGEGYRKTCSNLP
ncbi:nSTAND1 domain-containing NTPase [Microcoleus sp. B9-D4]|uniref:nSTAND1 domain-containing NTPase n=1 Tax=Microcoleus sp. B9-D4 TaxID=2818711 RepID=UPI002FD5FA88